MSDSGALEASGEGRLNLSGVGRVPPAAKEGLFCVRPAETTLALPPEIASIVYTPNTLETGNVPRNSFFLHSHHLVQKSPSFLS